MFVSVNPATEDELATYPVMSLQEAEPILAKLQSGYEFWREYRIGKRAIVFEKLARSLRDQSETLAALMSREMGKPLKQARGEVEKCAWVCEYYAENASSFLAKTPVTVDYGRAFVSYQPMGVVLAIMPWNFPLWQVLRFAAPTLMAGNVMLLKPAPNVIGTTKALLDIMQKAAGDVHIADLLCAEEATIAELIADPRIVGLSLTGSARAGRAVASLAGQHLKKCVLELGGSDPYIVLGDADIDLAAKTCVASRLLNSGQTCISAKRFIVVESVAQAFTKAVHKALSEATYGDPFEGDFSIGPMARRDLRDALHKQVTASIAQGAQLELGGFLPQTKGFFYPPTLLTHVKPGMVAFDEEIFGPVAAIVTAADEAEAIALANQSSLGLGGAIFSRDVQRATQLAETKLQVGCAFINDLVRSDPRLPFGGIKDSGFGRELGRHGIYEFVNIKTICAT